MPTPEPPLYSVVANSRLTFNGSESFCGIIHFTTHTEIIRSLRKSIHLVCDILEELDLFIPAPLLALHLKKSKFDLEKRKTVIMWSMCEAVGKKENRNKCSLHKNSVMQSSLLNSNRMWATYTLSIMNHIVLFIKCIVTFFTLTLHLCSLIKIDVIIFAF